MQGEYISTGHSNSKSMQQEGIGINIAATVNNDRVRRKKIGGDIKQKRGRPYSAYYQIIGTSFDLVIAPSMVTRAAG